MIYNAIIAGGGASGIVAAIKAASTSLDITRVGASRAVMTARCTRSWTSSSRRVKIAMYSRSAVVDSL